MPKTKSRKKKPPKQDKQNPVCRAEVLPSRQPAAFKERVLVTQLVMAIALLLGAKSSGLPPQTAESLIGSWKLVTVSAKTADGEAVDHPMGLTR